ncbi:MAG TPA: hypothetical protein VH479_23745 [Acidimicrobiales bacterium]
MRPGRRHVLAALPLLAVALIAIVASGVVGTLSQFTASITNPGNHVQSASVGLTETGQGGTACQAIGDGQWHDCTTINIYGAASLASGGSSTTTVTFRNTGNAAAPLFLLPSQCSDTLTGAHGALCDQATVVVTCGGAPVVTATLNGFHDGRNFPTGYPAGTLAAGASVACDFTVTAGTVTTPGAVSQPIAWKLVAGG